MLNYLSNDRYRVMGFGADLEGIETAGKALEAKRWR